MLDLTGPSAGALVKARGTQRIICSTSSTVWMFAVTLRMVDTLDSQSVPPRMRTRFSCSGLAEQRTFSIDGSGWSILASCHDCSITRAKARMLRKDRNEEQEVCTVRFMSPIHAARARERRVASIHETSIALDQGSECNLQSTHRAL
jgi:hypothetical protein